MSGALFVSPRAARPAWMAWMSAMDSFMDPGYGRAPTIRADGGGLVEGGRAKVPFVHSMRGGGRIRRRRKGLRYTATSRGLARMSPSEWDFRAAGAPDFHATVAG